MQYEHVTSEQHLVDFCRSIAGQQTIAIDTEFVSEYTYRPDLCLLQVEAGVEVRSVPHPGVGIEVQGQLDVNGVVGNEVRFISDAGTPAAGDWQGLNFSSSGTGTIG